MNTCGYCKFYSQHNWGDQGDCRRHAPRPVCQGENPRALWPTVRSQDWCGEYNDGDDID